ncbi:hypothetical protein DY000_02032609 [Brassica cretica]|uniref:Uncharacterized protein n=1 Tax=Brassica cretica TaxID=69181 RepID=A0ABQ7DP64_BRACR|nr:hypothetical protein DY000_02032609 [Brassica cretica]
MLCSKQQTNIIFGSGNGLPWYGVRSHGRRGKHESLTMNSLSSVLLSTNQLITSRNIMSGSTYSLQHHAEVLLSVQPMTKLYRSVPAHGNCLCCHSLEPALVVKSSSGVAEEAASKTLGSTFFSADLFFFFIVFDRSHDGKEPPQKAKLVQTD